MNGWIKKAMAAVLTGTIALSGAPATAWAANPTTDTNSSFANGTGTGDTTGIVSFSLIKDYDSVNPTGNTAPKSNSPAETVTYTIKPYGVWNAGSTYSDTNNGLGTATLIDKTNMPMNFGGTNGSVGGNGENRTWSITESLDLGDAIVPESTDSYLTTDNRTEITLPTYTTVGDYWYEVKETIGVGNPAVSTTGVFYGTNDAQTEDLTRVNGAHNAIYYLHVQVTETSSTLGTSSRVSNVTLHKTAPTAAWTDAQYNNSNNGEIPKYASEANDKVNAIENRYYAGDLVIKKAVTGNAGDKSEYFPVTVEFTKESGTIVNSDIPFTAVLRSGDGTTSRPYTYTSTDVTIKGQYYTGSEANTIRWKQGSDNSIVAGSTYSQLTKATVTFYVKDNSTVTFSNIPYGISYTVSETLPQNDNYKNKLEFTTSGDTTETTFDGITCAADTGAATLADSGNQATGSISDPSDTITITNDKNVTIDIGVVTKNAPYIAMIVVAGVAVTLMVARKKTVIED